MTSTFMVRLAWRNIWRQKRRTLLTASSLAIAMLLALFTRSMQEGSYAFNLDNATRFYSGYLQLQHPDFSENKSIDKLLPGDQQFIERIKSIPGLTEYLPRIESFALAAAAEKSKGVIVMGVDPQREENYSGLADRVAAGRYFNRDDERSVLVGSGLAAYFNLVLGDEIALYGQGYHGTTAAGLFSIAGIIKFPNKQIDARIIYLPLKVAQDLYVTGNQVTAWVLHGEDVHTIPELEADARQVMGKEIRVRDWADISPELAQQISLDRVSGQFMILVLYGVVGFGLFATVVMMTLERQREFAVMLATGMSRSTLQFISLLESFFLALTGVVMGLVVTTPILFWFYTHPIPLSGELAVTMEEMGFEPIIPFSLAPELFVGQIGIILGLLAICSIYPLLRIGRLRIMEAMKG